MSAPAAAAHFGAMQHADPPASGRGPRMRPRHRANVRRRLAQPTGVLYNRRKACGAHGAASVAVQKSASFCGESEMRTSEPKPHWINKLLVSFDSEVRKRACCTMMRTSESGH